MLVQLTQQALWVVGEILEKPCTRATVEGCVGAGGGGCGLGVSVTALQTGWKLHFSKGAAMSSMREQRPGSMPGGRPPSSRATAVPLPNRSERFLEEEEGNHCFCSPVPYPSLHTLERDWAGGLQPGLGALALLALAPGKLCSEHADQSRRWGQSRLQQWEPQRWRRWGAGVATAVGRDCVLSSFCLVVKERPRVVAS